AALATIDTDHLIAVAVDMPFMTTEHLRHLCGLAVKGAGVIPMSDENAEPLGAIYPKEARAVFLEALPGDNVSLQPIVQKLIALHMLREMPVVGADREFYRSINEPQDMN